MNKYPFISVFGAISTIAAIIGSVFFFINPTVTIVCAVISAVNSVVQVTFGEQNNFLTEISIIVISVIVALIINKPIFNIICFGICAGDAVMSILGWISILIFYKKRF